MLVASGALSSLSLKTSALAIYMSLTLFAYHKKMKMKHTPTCVHSFLERGRYSVLHVSWCLTEKVVSMSGLGLAGPACTHLGPQFALGSLCPQIPLYRDSLMLWPQVWSVRIVYFFSSSIIASHPPPQICRSHPLSRGTARAALRGTPTRGWHGAGAA